MIDKDKQKIKAKKFFSGFKDFIARGNVVDLAIGVIIGGAFGKIVTSLVNDIIMPPLGILLGGMDFKDLVWELKAPVLDPVTNEVIKAAVNMRYGQFIMIILEFVIIAFTIYAALTLVIRRRDFIKKVEEEEKALKEAEETKEEENEEETKGEIEVSEDILLLREIRDLLMREKGEKNEKEDSSSSM